MVTSLTNLIKTLLNKGGVFFFFLNNELYHYGVLGMKWGVRRYQNKDGSLTNAGRKRYDVDIEGVQKNLKNAKQNSKTANKEYNRKTLGGLLPNEEAIKKLNDADMKLKWAKDDLRSEKTKQKLNEENKTKSEHRLNLEQHYLDKGMNQEEAEIAAYQRAKIEKILMVTAGVTVTAAAAYVAYKHYDRTVDKILKSGVSLQNISTDESKGVSNAFYAAYNKSDKIKYKGLYGNQLRKPMFAETTNKVYDTTIGVKNNLKIASEKNAAAKLSELVRSDSEYRKALETHLIQTSQKFPLTKQQQVINKGLRTLEKGKVDSNVYKALNISLVNHESYTSDTVAKGFYNKLKASGYDAIIDINDKRYSGYRSKNPVIVFNDSKVAVDKIREMGEKEISKNKRKAFANILLETMPIGTIKEGGIAAASILGVKAVNTKINDNIVRKYRKEHPNTKLSYKEILRNYNA